MVKSFEIPWAAWKDPGTMSITFPDSWDVTNCKMNGADAPVLSHEQIKHVINHPIGTPRLSELAKGKERVVIVVDDLTRTTPIHKIIPHVLEDLRIGGIKNEKISILLALGAHRPMNRNDCILKLGKDVVNSFNIENHHPYENLIDLGESKAGTPIEVNATYYKADLKIAIGGVIPHPLAGFGGGAKIVLPGVCGIRTLEGNHSAGMRGIGAGIGRLTQIREDIEDTAERIGLDFSINAILTERGDVSALTAGHFKIAHRKAMEIAKQNYGTKVPLNNQACFFNLFPEDSELNQAVKGFNFLMTAPNGILERKGTIVLMSSSHEGRGYHSLIAETGARLYSNFENSVLWKGFVKRRNVLFFSPNINQHDLEHFYPPSVELFHDWDALIERLGLLHGENLKAAIIPCSIQLSE